MMFQPLGDKPINPVSGCHSQHSKSKRVINERNVILEGEVVIRLTSRYPLGILIYPASLIAFLRDTSYNRLNSGPGPVIHLPQPKHVMMPPAVSP